MDSVQVFFHSQQPYSHVTDEDLANYEQYRLYTRLAAL